MQNPGTIADAPSGRTPIGESRFGTNDIRLSSALCALGFFLKLDAQPLTVTIDADTEKRIVTFYHEDATKLGNFTARDVDLWWNSPKGKYTIVGYDDALNAMRRVHLERWQMIELAKHAPGRTPTRQAVVASSSIHTASVLAACEIQCLGYDASSRQWIFAKGAEVIAALIKTGGKPKERPLSNDLCIDWMLESLRYHDWLKKLIDHPDNVPVVEMRNGERILMISKNMNELDASSWISRL